MNRTVTIYASGSVSVDDALEESKIVIKQQDIRDALGVGEKQWVPPLSSAKISHFFNPTSQRLGISVKGKGESDIVENAAMARDPFEGKMKGFTAVIPSITQGNLDQKLVPINSAKSVSAEQAEMMSKWRGLTSEDLTDGLMQVLGTNPDGSTRVVMYNVPLVKTDGNPQPVARKFF